MRHFPRLRLMLLRNSSARGMSAGATPFMTCSMCRVLGFYAASILHTPWQVSLCPSDTHLVPLSNQFLRAGHILCHAAPRLALGDAQLEGNVLHPVLHLPKIVIEGRYRPEDTSQGSKHIVCYAWGLVAAEGATVIQLKSRLLSLTAPASGV